MKNHIIDRLKIGRYSNPENIGYSGYLQPKDLSWIIYFGLDGRPTHYYPERDKDGGVVEKGSFKFDK